MKDSGRMGSSMARESTTMQKDNVNKENGTTVNEYAGSMRIPASNTNKFILRFIDFNLIKVTFECLHRSLHSSLFLKILVFTPLTAGMIIGPGVGFLFQAFKIWKRGNSEGYSNFVSFILLIANLSRIPFW